MKSIVKKTAILALLLALVFVFSGCTKIKENRTITIAYNPNAYASAISQIMISENILSGFLPEDVNVKWVEMSSASDIRDALASGSVDIATPALTAFISAHENNLPIRLLSNYGAAQVSLYSTTDISDITQFQDTDVIAIKGLNSNPHIALLAYCKENGLDVAMFNSILNKIPETETLAMLQSNFDLSGAVLSYPVAKKADELETCHLLVDFSDIVMQYNLGTVVCVNTKFYDENYDLVMGFEDAHKYIVDNWNDDSDKYSAILAQQYSCSKEEVLNLMQTLPPTMEIVGYDKLATLMFECSMLSSFPASFDEVKK